MEGAMIHQTAEVSDQAQLGPDTRVWHHAHIRENARVGAHCVIGKDVYIDRDVVIGDSVKIQNGAYVYHGATLEDGVFIGPGVCLTNDKYPRAITPHGDLKGDDDWEVLPILVRRGASVGARAVVLPGVVIGRCAMIGAGAVVTKDVPDHGLVQGNPAVLVGFVCACGRKLTQATKGDDPTLRVCDLCQASFALLTLDIGEEQRDSDI
jgi:UDP-2-acetamido-3-amino-2,3-dideoxy-glucuronate N-acetyltransferase